MIKISTFVILWLNAFIYAWHANTISWHYNHCILSRNIFICLRRVLQTSSHFYRKGAADASLQTNDRTPYSHDHTLQQRLWTHRMQPPLTIRITNFHHPTVIKLTVIVFVIIIFCCCSLCLAVYHSSFQSLHVPAGHNYSWRRERLQVSYYISVILCNFLFYSASIFLLWIYIFHIYISLAPIVVVRSCLS